MSTAPRTDNYVLINNVGMTSIRWICDDGAVRKVFTTVSTCQYSFSRDKNRAALNLNPCALVSESSPLYDNRDGAIKFWIVRPQLRAVTIMSSFLMTNNCLASKWYTVLWAQPLTVVRQLRFLYRTVSIKIKFQNLILWHPPDIVGLWSRHNLW